MSVSSIKEVLLARIRAREAQVGIIGLGYVGLPLALAFVNAGFKVIGVDTNVERCAEINKGQSHIGDVPDRALLPHVRAGKLRATADYSALASVDAVLICVPTPLSKSKDPDISFIVAAVDALAPQLHKGMLVVLESTTYPGTTQELLVPRLDGKQWTIGQDLFVAFSPERVDPGNRYYNIQNTPKVVGGVTPSCLEVASTLYEAVVERVVPVSSPATAEMIKILENTFRAVNIALVNEMAQICHRLDIDIWEVVAAAATKPFGFMPFYPGPGIGGHCIPIDPLYLTWKMRNVGMRTRFIELADTVNSGMPLYVVARIQDALNDRGKPLNGSEILILGVSYKKDVADIRESTALTIIQELQRRKARVSYHDPFVPKLTLVGGEQLGSVHLCEKALQEADCVLVHTDHSAYDWSWIAEHARLVFDTRNVVPRRSENKVLRL